jgi:hypothetical protein
MEVQREDTTGMETILLEDVYQGHYVKLKGWSEDIWRSTSGLVMYMDTQECHIQVRCTGSIKTLIMLDSREKLHMTE